MDALWSWCGWSVLTAGMIFKPCRSNKLMADERTEEQKKKGRELLISFERMKGRAEMNVLSKHSLEHPLTDEQFHRFKSLGEKVLGVNLARETGQKIRQKARQKVASEKIILRRDRAAEELDSLAGPVYWAEDRKLQFGVSIVGPNHEMKIKISTPRGKNFLNVAGMRTDVRKDLAGYLQHAVGLFNGMEYAARIEGKNIVIGGGG